MNPTEKEEALGFLTKEAFEKLLTKASQPIPKEESSQASEQTSEPHQRDD